MFFVPWVVCLYDLVSLGGKDNVLEPVNHIATSMSSALDLLTSNLIGDIFPSWVVHMYDMVTLGRKGNVLVPAKRISTSMCSALDL
jgi:hypothetical protein